MAFDWLKSLRTSLRPAPRKSKTFRLATPTHLESRTLLSAVPVGPESLVNNFTTGGQVELAMAMDADGDYVITWMSQDQDGDGYGVYARRYDSAGVPQGDEFQINTYTTHFQGAQTVAMDADGDFVITWISYERYTTDWEIRARRYSASGAAQGDDFVVFSATNQLPNAPCVTMDADGDFLISVVWKKDSEQGIYAQSYDAQGVPQGTETRLIPFLTNQNAYHRMARDAQGNLVIVWSSYGLDGDDDGVFGQRLDPLGNPQGDVFQVNTYTTSSQFVTSLAMDAEGGFVICWESLYQDGSGRGVYARLYDSEGTPLGDEFRVNSQTEDNQRQPKVAREPDGDFIVTWWSRDLDGTAYNIYARCYDAQGVPQGSEFLVNTYLTDWQYTPAISVDADGDFVIVWTSNGQVGDSDDSYAQRFRVGHPDNPGIWRSSKFYLDSDHSNTWSGATDDTLNTFGASTDKPLAGDWNGDGYDDIGIWRNGTFYLDANGNGIWDGPAIDQKFNFGNSTDTPIVGDWNNDGKSDIGVWRAGKFYLDLDGNHAWNSGVDAYYSFGSITDTPIIGDWNGDGTDDIGIWRAGKFYLDLNGNRAWNSSVDGIFTFGNSSDTPIIGDWNGDGIDDIGIWRAGKFYQDADGSRSWNSGLDAVISYGSSTDTPLIGYWRPKTLPGTPPAPALLPGAASPITASTLTSAETPESSPVPSTDPELLASLIATPTKKLNPWESP